MSCNCRIRIYNDRMCIHLSERSHTIFNDTIDIPEDGSILRNGSYYTSDRAWSYEAISNDPSFHSRGARLRLYYDKQEIIDILAYVEDYPDSGVYRLSCYVQSHIAEDLSSSGVKQESKTMFLKKKGILTDKNHATITIGIDLRSNTVKNVVWKISGGKGTSEG